MDDAVNNVCGTCRHWNCNPDHGEDWGDCWLAEEGDSMPPIPEGTRMFAWGSYEDGFLACHADFGCVEWKAHS